jgi:hypothetical protein
MVMPDAEFLKPLNLLTIADQAFLNACGLHYRKTFSAGMNT